MSGLRFAVVILLALLLQLALVDRMSIAGVKPDVTVLLLVLISVRRGPTTGTLLGFALGLMQDLLAESTLGMNMLAKTLIGYGAGKLSGNLLVGGLPLYAILTGVALLVHDLIFFVPYTSFDLVQLLGMFFTRSLPTALYTAVVALGLLILASLLSGGRFSMTEDSG